ncbi:MAG: 5-(carboxyamino)imidazole ribonucleotide mutase [Spirochaetaceae bacterium]|jgi:5-(carboxyamino)imidazole ribonucleotide mutase|nr:5-(carboxyamino)imidazole ribonucleotide mutase [Spirochaetaceae bacterium]
MKVAIIMGSPSDKPVMGKAADALRELEVDFSAWVLSAHRAPEALRAAVSRFEEEGVEAVIAGAGLAAHLPGVIASQTLIPVIGVPIVSGALGGLDALLSMVQMPKPVPVAVVGVDNGANAAYLACRILAVKYPALRERLSRFHCQMQADGASKEEAAL